MTAAMAMPGNTAEAFLVHFFGTGLADDRYVVERFRARADGDIVPAPAEAPRAKGGRKPRRVTATLKAVREMRPACTEIIICTGLKTRGGWQLWGTASAPISGRGRDGALAHHAECGGAQRCRRNPVPRPRAHRVRTPLIHQRQEDLTLLS